jgi:hypothetical protein
MPIPKAGTSISQGGSTGAEIQLCKKPGTLVASNQRGEVVVGEVRIMRALTTAYQCKRFLHIARAVSIGGGSQRLSQLVISVVRELIQHL